MVGKPSKMGQLIMFLTGPGGSGKSEIINQLLSYAEKFCYNIQQPFTRNTILVTACSGVAATLIHGQTLHSATFLNTNISNIDVDEKAKFRNCVKMIIIDEISMLSGTEIKALSKRLNWLKDNHTGVYGGIHIVFIGDF
jgi:thymidine kinase